MATQTHRIINSTQGSLLSEGVQELDATFEHLTVLRVLIEGLADNHEAGLWLTQVKGIPAVPRISPFDLIYVDEKQRVVEAVELLPAGEQPPFEDPAVSALVLPFQTISATQTRIGDQLVIDGLSEPGEAAEVEQQTAHAGSVEQAAVAVVAEEIPVVQEPPAATANIVAEAAPVAEAEPVVQVEPAQLPRPDEHTARTGGGKKKRKNTPRTRKARRLAAIAEKNRETAEAARSLRAQPAPAPPESTPQRVPAPTPQAVAQPVPVPQPVPKPVPQSVPWTVSQTIPQPVLQFEPPTVLQHAVAVPIPAGAPAAATSVQVSKALVALIQKGRITKRSDTKSANEGGNIMAAVNRFLHWMNPAAVDKEQRASIRRQASELAAYVGPEEEPKKLQVGDISSTGVYLRTEERWDPGTKVALTLQRNGPAEHREDKRVEVEADAVRWGKDGVALEFAFPEAMRLDLWEAAAKGEASETGPDYIVHEMRMARALGVFRSICPEAEEKATRMLRKEFSSVRVASGIRIALMAERLLRPRAEANGLRVPANLLLHALEMGSLAEEGWAQSMWAGLLASACTSEGDDQSNAPFAEILSHIAPVHLRILEMVCRRALTAAQEGAQAAVCTIGELTKGLDLTNVAKTLRTVSELGDHGLMTPVRRSPSDPLDTEARTSATRMGLQMYARCHGQRGDEEAFVRAAQILPGA